MGIRKQQKDRGADPPSRPEERRTSAGWWARRPLWLRVSAVVALVALLGWALVPAARSVSLVANFGGRGASDGSEAGIPVREIHFKASDGEALAGWLALASPTAPTIILAHGFKASRTALLPWARYLYAAGYNVLLYDSRGCGESAGWEIGLGAREPADIVGAVRYLQALGDLRVKRFAALGVSLGAGEVLLAAAQESALVATIADSPWADERPQLARTATMPLGPLALPLLPYAPVLLDTLVGTQLDIARPVAAVARIAPRAVMIITSADDANATTLPADQQRIFAAAGEPKIRWIARHGGHAGALAANPGDYEAATLAFLAKYVGAPKTA